MNFYKALRILALKAAIKPDGEALLRHIFRWYSKTFSTPLHEVYDIPVEDILTAFYEDKYENMEPADRDKELAELLQTPEDEKREALERDMDEFNAEMFARETERKEKAKKLKDLHVATERPLIAKPMMKETDLPSVPASKQMSQLPENITITFADIPDETEEQDSLGKKVT